MVDNKPVFFLLLVDIDDVNDGRLGPVLSESKSIKSKKTIIEIKMYQLILLISSYFFSISVM